jgi:hypothetical protein
MFLEIGSVLRKKGRGRPTKRTAENIEEIEQRIAETPSPSGDKPKKLTYHLVQFSLSFKKICTFFPIVCLLCILDNKSPHNITSLNIDRWIDL